MIATRTLLPLVLLAALPAAAARPADYKPTSLAPPSPTREFRGAWVASVGNIDWPSRNDLAVSEQRTELLAILDRAVQLRLNAIILQVRPACDALYASPLEPWSEYLTGTMGKAPEPFYDPLAFAIDAAHRRGLELHAWFNPYRARHPNAKSPISIQHVSKTRPQLVRSYGSYLWLDPGEKAVQDYSLSVVMDVVNRYDVDGIHFDDYFYPYPERLPGGKDRDFPDEVSWNKFRASNPQRAVSREDWRRENVNAFVRRVHESLKAGKPWVKFGISPFGIWRPGHPAQIRGLDAYDKLYADARLWLVNGWVDYLAPQLYWSIAAREQSFPVLLDWWDGQNSKQRHVWPGLNTVKAREAWKPEEILNQISLARGQPVSAGHVHWNMGSLMRNAALAAALARGAYAEPALVPPFKWLDSTPPGKPQLRIVAGNGSSVRVSWQPSQGEKACLWVLQHRRDGAWATRILPAESRSLILDGEPPEAIAISAVDRAGNVSSAAALASTN
jgi:uncharacterized lipoprotein YddW (UPF0748 family)